MRLSTLPLICQENCEEKRLSLALQLNLHPMQDKPALEFGKGEKCTFWVVKLNYRPPRSRQTWRAPTTPESSANRARTKAKSLAPAE